MQSAKSLIELTNQCVRCGLCLPHCPTYQLNQEETESPRGRIAMLAAIANKEIAWQPSIQHHIDQCLACGHCERVCPAQVQYGKLLIDGRENLANKHSVSWKKKFVIKLIETPILRNTCYAIIYSLQTAHLWNACTAIAARFSKKLAHAMRMVPPPIRKNSLPHKKTPSESLKKILLFPGCSGNIFGRATLACAKQLLFKCGYACIEPQKSLCCGALSAHAGLSEHTMQRTAQALHQLCVDEEIEHIVMIATGCSSFANNMTALQPSLRIMDIQKFLQAHLPIKNMPPNQKPLRIAVHTPCTQTNGLSNPRLSYDLLKDLPNVTLIAFGESSCCGASGTYMLECPEKATQFAAQLLTNSLLNECDIIVTSNIGCQLHFQNFLKTQNVFLPVCHPIEVLLKRFAE